MSTRELTFEEAEALTKDLQAVLEKHGAEMQTKTTIELVKRVENEATETSTGPNTETEESSDSSDGESDKG